MANKKITDLQLRASVTGDCNFPVDDGVQSYRVTAVQVKAYVLSAGVILRSMIAPEERIPVGGVMPFAGSVAPSGFLLTDGSEVNRITYADLFAAISTTYGVGNGSTTFNLPNTSGLFIQGVGTQTVDSKSFVAGALGVKSKDSTARPTSAFTTGTESADHTHVLSSQPSTTGSTTIPGRGSGSPVNNYSTGGRSADHTHTVTSGGDTYTKPGSISFNHIIKF